MLVCFELSMPNCGSWNGQWSGKGNVYARVQNLSVKLADKVTEQRSYYYNFGDGWGASVRVRIVDRKEANQIRKRSRGFSGYDWMIDSIKHHGEIRNDT